MEDTYLTNTRFEDLILEYLINEIIKEEKESYLTNDLQNK